MKTGRSILIIILALSTGCMARKIITIPAKAAVKTTLKTSGKMTVGTVKVLTTDGDQQK